VQGVAVESIGSIVVTASKANRITKTANIIPAQPWPKMPSEPPEALTRPPRWLCARYAPSVWQCLHPSIRPHLKDSCIQHTPPPLGGLAVQAISEPVLHVPMTP